MTDKFLTDGRKVRVIGKLNNNESIVQEIFITKDGSEIPSGENFTAKSLHESPVETFKDRELKKKEDRIKSIELEIENTKSKEKSAREELKKVNLLLKSSKALKNSIGENDIGIMADFLTGQIEYLVFDEYEIKPPVKMEHKMFSYESHWGDRTIDELKLVSVMGKSGGDLSYRIHQYSDHSGSSIMVYPFTKYEDALDKIKEIAIGKINSHGCLSIGSFNVCKSLGITFDPDHVEIFKAAATKSLRGTIKSNNDTIEKCTKSKSEAEQKIADIESL